MIITGDLLQSDKHKINGLSDLIQKYKKYNLFTKLDNIKLIKLENDDIQRNPIIHDILNLYNNKINYNSSLIFKDLLYGSSFIKLPL